MIVPIDGGSSLTIKLVMDSVQVSNVFLTLQNKTEKENRSEHDITDKIRVFRIQLPVTLRLLPVTPGERV